MTSTAQQVSAQGQESKREKQRKKKQDQEIIAVESAEGRPAHPEVGPKGFGVILIFVAVLLMLLATILAFAMGQAIAALAIGGLALLIFITNPEVWATVLRSKERSKIQQGQQPEQ